MCEYVPIDGEMNRQFSVDVDVPLDVGGLTIHTMDVREGHYYECWHPETDSWEAMYPPTEKLGLKMSPGSKVRLRKGDPPAHTKNAPPSEYIVAGTQMRDLIH